MFNFIFATLMTLLVCGRTGWTTSQERREERVALAEISGYPAVKCSTHECDYRPADSDVKTMGIA